jgi:putative ABC transport system permease protein
LTEALDSTLAQNRFRTVLVSLFSAMALTLAAIGLYGVMAYMVTQRTKEIGVRVALGARPGQILSEVLRSGGKLTLAGAIVGIVLAALASRFAGTLLYGIRSFDTATYLGAAGVLIAVALLACLIPGRRATAIDPVQALRE